MCEGIFNMRNTAKIRKLKSIIRYVNSEENEHSQSIRALGGHIPLNKYLALLDELEGRNTFNEYQEIEITPNDIQDNGEEDILIPSNITTLRKFLEYEDGYESVKNKEIAQKDIAAEFDVSTQRVSMLMRQIKLKRMKNQKKEN